MSTGGQPLGAAGKVPALDTAIDSYRFVFANLDRFFALGWLPLLITFAAYMGSDVLDDVGGGENASVADWVAYAALEAVSLAVYAVFAVRWHRFFLHDDRESVFSEIFSARDWRFIGYTLLLFYSPLVPMLAPLLISGFVSVLISIAGFVLLFVMTRFSLVLPGTAVDRPLGLGEAWHKMLGHTWRFIRAFLLVLIPSVIPSVILAWIVYQSTGTTNDAPEPTIGVLVATNVVLAIVGFFATAAGITVLSKFYRHIVGMDAPGGGAAEISA